MIAPLHHYDVVIVGSGIGGLAAAKTYLEPSPNTNLILLEARETLGGVWAKENCYDGLKTNNIIGTYEFSDFPMDAKYGIKDGRHIPGFAMHQYLTDFARHYDIFRRIRFNVRVNEVHKSDNGGWDLMTVSTPGHETEETIIYHTEKLIMCTGLASRANPVNIKGVEDFGKPVLNHSQMTVEADLLARDTDAEVITVVGASKTGYDAVHLFASQGKGVDWIVRESGGGGVWMSLRWVLMGPWRVLLEPTATMRFMSWFSPCIWGDFDGYGLLRRLLHGTWLGRLLVHKLWEKIRWDTVAVNRYRMDPCLAHLEPRECLFWSARVGILNYPTDIHDYVRSGQVKIYRKDISHLGSGTVNFVDGSRLRSDGLIAITGWRLVPGIKYTPEGIDASLGIPSAKYNPVESEYWRHLDRSADREITQRFPYLRNPPKAKLPFKQSVTPFRLYRGIAPPGLTVNQDQSLAFIKMVHSTSNFIIAEAQALWIYAYLNNKLPIERSQVFWNTALTSRFRKWRYPWGFSQWYPEFVYDAVPYADMLLSDLSLDRERKRRGKTGSLLREWFEGYTVHDYKGLNLEWKAQQLASPGVQMADGL
ncbi:hypothetical protein PV05_11566 [Exophiala xenobiotica]|uniref:FAD/NAD(P)-binding domain-containing protein n=1 Tax=Exophiala xenobiotica TaxID=348802 RepID=A0A0D2E5C7_9EURO|nr:uncharacterized protein PV05_11566 [Exophiala xenobiotica]KIW49935.1 hypothetical protein PV05_11566 [Exophiala xenobiotica]